MENTFTPGRYNYSSHFIDAIEQENLPVTVTGIAIQEPSSKTQDVKEARRLLKRALDKSQELDIDPDCLNNENPDTRIFNDLF